MRARLSNSSDLMPASYEVVVSWPAIDCGPKADAGSTLEPR